MNPLEILRAFYRGWKIRPIAGGKVEFVDLHMRPELEAYVQACEKKLHDLLIEEREKKRNEPDKKKKV